MTENLGPGEVDPDDLCDPDDLAPWRPDFYDPNDYESRQDLPDPDGYRWPED